jgi:hypothetical protein
VGEVAAGEVGRRVGLDPGDVVQQLELELLHRKPDRVNHVAGAADPNRPVGLERALAEEQPGFVELVVGVGAAGAVPVAFVDADHAAGVAGDAVVGEEVGRVGEDEVHRVGREGGEQLQAIPVVNRNVVLCIPERRLRQCPGRSGSRRPLRLRGRLALAHLFEFQMDRSIDRSKRSRSI